MSVTKILFYLFNFVVVAVEGSRYWTECDGLHFYQRNFINRYHDCFPIKFLFAFFTSLGMNVKDFQHKWGGEDWDLVDRVLNVSAEVERIRYPGLYHHFHAKKRNWN